MRLSRILLAATAAAALAVPAAPTRADIFGDLFGSLKGRGGIVQLLEMLISVVWPIEGVAPMPPTIDGQVLSGTQEPIGQAPGSYVTGSVPSASPLFPPEGNQEWLPPDGTSTYADLRLRDRGARVDEAEALASAVTADDRAAPARLDGYIEQNTIGTNVGDTLRLGNTIGIESAGQLHKLTSLQAEANQLEADQRLQEDWARKQADLMNHAVFANGYWAGARKWQPDQQAGAGY